MTIRAYLRGSMTVLGVVLAVGVSGTPPAGADEWDGDNWALNGIYVATSNGDWAATDDVYRNEATVVSRWTISMNCPDVLHCSGMVSSDAGWGAPISLVNTEYVVLRDIPAWEPCPNGAAAVTGHQRIRFSPVNDVGYIWPGSHYFSGVDKTLGESGGCRDNDTLEIAMPFTLQKSG
ncbi:MAG: hypothetical protein HYZ39_21370 [Mycolicibacterium cosmeticum]|nr:hypothetical protein [Mycolicibacterium cosmeticum]